MYCSCKEPKLKKVCVSIFKNTVADVCKICKKEWKIQPPELPKEKKVDKFLRLNGHRIDEARDAVKRKRAYDEHLTRIGPDAESYDLWLKSWETAHKYYE